MSNTRAEGRSTTKTSTRIDRKPVRVPMSGSRKRMEIDKDDLDAGFHYAWISDTKDLIFRSKRAGYENVLTSEIPSWGVADVDTADSSSSVVSMPVGPGVQGYFMKQPMEYYEEDQKAMSDLVEKTTQQWRQWYVWRGKYRNSLVVSNKSPTLNS